MLNPYNESGPPQPSAVFGRGGNGASRPIYEAPRRSLVALDSGPPPNPFHQSGGAVPQGGDGGFGGAPLSLLPQPPSQRHGFGHGHGQGGSGGASCPVHRVSKAADSSAAESAIGLVDDSPPPHHHSHSHSHSHHGSGSSRVHHRVPPQTVRLAAFFFLASLVSASFGVLWALPDSYSVRSYVFPPRGSSEFTVLVAHLTTSRSGAGGGEPGGGGGGGGDVPHTAVGLSIARLCRLALEHPQVKVVVVGVDEARMVRGGSGPSELSDIGKCFHPALVLYMTLEGGQGGLMTDPAVGAIDLKTTKILNVSPKLYMIGWNKEESELKALLQHTVYVHPSNSIVVSPARAPIIPQDPNPVPKVRVNVFFGDETVLVNSPDEPVVAISPGPLTNGHVGLVRLCRQWGDEPWRVCSSLLLQV